MKRFVASILALIYLNTSIGVGVHVHYCMGKVASWGLGNQEPKSCSGCGMEKPEQKDSGCCKDKYTFFKNITDQKITESSLQVMPLMTVGMHPSFTENLSFSFLSHTKENHISHAPPLNHGIPIYILNCIYRI